MKAEPRILVVDIGGTNVKCALGTAAGGREGRVKFPSGPGLRPEKMIEGLREATRGWSYDVVSIGYPGVVKAGKVERNPHNLGKGWVGFDFRRALRKPVKIVNDAAMQALGGYRGGRMLFMGLGTGLGTTLIVDGVLVPLELGHLRYSDTQVFEDRIGEAARLEIGNKRWRARVAEIVEEFRDALMPDEILLGGGNSALLEDLPPQTRVGGNADAIRGGFRLWDERTGIGTRIARKARQGAALVKRMLRK